MNNFVIDGRTLTLVAPSGGVTAGIPILIGALVVVPVTSAAQGELFAGVHEGVVTVAKATGTAHALGAVVDWDPTPGNVVAAGNVATNFTLGFCVEAAGSSDTTIKVKLIANPVTVQAGA